MKSKLVNAYLPESSNTTRITPEDTGTLMATMSDEQCKRAVESFLSQMYIVSDKRKKEYIENYTKLISILMDSL